MHLPTVRLPTNLRLPISKGGAVSRLLLGAIITFMAAIQMTHTLGKPIDFWAVFGAVLLAFKDVQSFINQAWGQAFLTTTQDAALTAPPADSATAPPSGDSAVTAPSTLSTGDNP